MEGSTGDTTQTVEEKPMMSVAALASRFSHGTSNALEKHEKPINRPTRRKPPCSLPLHCTSGEIKTESDHNGAEKPPINDSSRHLKLKMKTSSPLIEKLQASLVLSPTVLLPGICPKSPLKSCFSPFGSPPSTPSSPGIRSRSSESADESPVTFDQPPGAEPLQSLHKGRVRLSLKRRPPSRRFRKSLTEDTDSPDGEKPVNSAKNVEPQENGAAEEENSEVFGEQNMQTDNPDPKNSPSPEEGSPPTSETPMQTETSDAFSSESKECERSASTSHQENSGQDVSAVKNTEECSDMVTEASEGAEQVTACCETMSSKMSEQESLSNEPSIKEPEMVDAVEQSLDGEEESRGNDEE
ncbi:capZ-interacting protein [Callorhinchus milii]|uniref:CapZ-interacting protein-like protein n=1 Tax=Callorhinchus milii TaxID=7868 RepID=V9KZT5_CALMI|nr:capZ-interacting protein [Callorhinchus milii]|eukprot:gi/632956547/ref/XP_007894010.1/ PREDICTED: capZ-interacting protein [Callorhinchus milii]